MESRPVVSVAAAAPGVWNQIVCVPPCRVWLRMVALPGYRAMATYAPLAASTCSLYSTVT